MSLLRLLCALVLLVPLAGLADEAHEALTEGKVLVAAAASVKPAMEEIARQFRDVHPAVDLTISYGSSGKISTQIIHGAPFDLFFSADTDYPQALLDQGQAGSDVRPYAEGKLVLWQRGASKPRLERLTEPAIARLAMANPRHAPYGQRARDILKRLNLWDSIQDKLVFGENVAQAAQFIQSGAAELGFIPLSIALSPVMQRYGSYTLISNELQDPLVHGYVFTRRGKDNPAAALFAEFVESAEAQAILGRHGFEAVPG